jgi:outer membrane protein assembly factor BamB
MPSEDAAARAAAAAHTAAAVRGAHAARDAAAHAPPDRGEAHQGFQPVHRETSGARLPHRPVASTSSHAAPAKHAAPPPQPQLQPRPQSQAYPAILDLPDEFMPGPRRRTPPAPPPRPSLGSVPLGRIELNDPHQRRARGAAKRWARKPTFWVAACLAAVLVLGIAATWAATGPHGTEARGLAPDIASQPALGEPLVIGGLSPEQTGWTGFGPVGSAQAEAPPLVNDGIVMLYAPSDQGTALAAVDAESGDTEWKVDLPELSGEEATRWAELWWNGDDGVVVGAELGLDGGAVGLVSKAGQLGELRHGARLMGTADGLVAMVQSGRVVVAAANDLEKDLWTAEATDTCADRVLINHDGTFLVCTADGFADAATGEPVGIREYLEDPGVAYSLFDGGVLIRIASQGSAGAAGGHWMRVDPKTGEELWEQGASFADYVWPVRGGQWLFATGAELEGAVHCVDPDSGRLRWSRPADWFLGTVGSTAFVASADGQVSALKAATGGLSYQFRVRSFGDQWPGVVFGAKTLYQVDGGGLLAYPLSKNSEPRWSLDLAVGPAGQGGLELRLGGGDLWVTDGGELRRVE